MAMMVAVLALVPAGWRAEVAHHDGVATCATRACEVRVRHRRWRAYTRPYRPWLRRVRRCESGGAYTINTGNGFFGAYQFTISSWRAVGGWGLPHRASPLHQDYRAVRLLHLQGRGAWPVCG